MRRNITTTEVENVQIDSGLVILNYLSGVGTLQAEIATVVGTIGASGAGNATVIVTAAGMAGSPKTIPVAVANNDTASQVAGKIRTALAADAAVTALFSVGGAGATVALTKKEPAANDATLNISIDNGTCSGLTAAANSANTTAGVAATAREIGLTKGGTEFKVKHDMRQIEHDGAMGDEVGMDRIVKVESTMKLSILSATMENLKLALPGATLNEGKTKLTGPTSGTIPSTDYISDITIIGQTMKGEFKRVTIFNGLGNGALSWKTKDKDEGAFDVEFRGSFDPSDKTKPNYEIEDLSSYEVA